MKLYSYQENVLLAVESDPSHSQLISMPTGTGKTITFLALAAHKNKNTLILVHRNELLEQTHEKAVLLGFKEEEISLIRSENKNDFKKLNIAMVATLSRNLEKYDPNHIELVIIDEAHHAKANTYINLLKYFKVFEEKKLLFGFTATPLRGDGKELSDIFLSHSFKMTLSEATKSGYICPVRGIKIEIDKSLENLDLKNGDYDISQLDSIMNCDSVNKLIADKLEHLGKTPGIIFCTSINHAKNLAALLRIKKRKAISVSYETPTKTLEKIFYKLKSGKIDFITNAIKLSEGFDYPKISSVILARPTRSPVLYKQMIGRGLRKAENKHECLVLEFSGNDPSMVCWDDIDENCSFQCASAQEKMDRKKALEFYKSRFKSPEIKILDVRISPFSFYECFIRRIFKYKKQYECAPTEDGFILFQFRPGKKRLYDDCGFLTYTWMCFWKEKYKTFYIWDGGGPLWDSNIGWPFKECSRQVEYYLDRQCSGHLGKWYPSEEETQSFSQRQFLSSPPKTNARKTEMIIEECAIKEAIQKYWIDGKSEIEVDGDETNLTPKHMIKLYELSGKY